MSPFIKDEIHRLPGPLQTLPIELVEVSSLPVPIIPYEGCRGPVESLTLLYVGIRVYKNAFVLHWILK